jgi:DNA-binding CsgD family transcriptional regulator
MIISTAGNTPCSLGDLVCAATSFDDVQTDLLPALADDLDADSAGFYQAIRDGDSVRLGHSVVTNGVGPEPQHTWQQQFDRLAPTALAPPIPAATAQAFPLDEWLDFPKFLRSPAYETFWGPLGIHHAMIIRLAHHGDESFVFGLHRTAGGRRFCDAEVARVGGLLAPLVSTLSRLRLAEEVERLRGGHAVGVPVLAGLTRREHEIASDVAEGLANKHIARRRGVSVHTVENHLRSIFRKTGVDSRTKLALAADVNGSYPVGG